MSNKKTNKKKVAVKKAAPAPAPAPAAPVGYTEEEKKALRRIYLNNANKVKGILVKFNAGLGNTFVWTGFKVTSAKGTSIFLCNNPFSGFAKPEDIGACIKLIRGEFKPADLKLSLPMSVTHIPSKTVDALAVACGKEDLSLSHEASTYVLNDLIKQITPIPMYKAVTPEFLNSCVQAYNFNFVINPEKTAFIRTDMPICIVTDKPNDVKDKTVFASFAVVRAPGQPPTVTVLATSEKDILAGKPPAHMALSSVIFNDDLVMKSADRLGRIVAKTVKELKGDK